MSIENPNLKNDKASKYESPDFVTLYRYENPTIAYDERREGEVSKKEIVGQWFTDKIDDLKTYIKMRQPGGRIIVIRVAKAKLAEFDASNKEATKNMDIEKGNYIVPPEVQSETLLQIPLDVKSTNPKKFLMQDWLSINDFINKNLSIEHLVELATNS